MIVWPSNDSLVFKWQFDIQMPIWSSNDSLVFKWQFGLQMTVWSSNDSLVFKWQFDLEMTVWSSNDILSTKWQFVREMRMFCIKLELISARRWRCSCPPRRRAPISGSKSKRSNLKLKNKIIVSQFVKIKQDSVVVTNRSFKNSLLFVLTLNLRLYLALSTVKTK